ncbi:hypothetical protein [Cupriavidus plantarum]|uniref:DUF4393 domain-containing protein n=1 Tax=Cupriavidus plantarum TaxID=942865 RepID=A0A316EPU4_9BURK|nr:hypothetical protein [Cupriavidus plantarum]PWK33470.1 hypothetical protein C7419_104145 [Cupriavidus plantarum]
MDPTVLVKWMSEGALSVGFAQANYVGAVAEAALSRFMRRRVEAARDILQEEIRRGTKRPMQATSEEEGAAIVYRYMRASQEGAARLNLRLLAQAMAGSVGDAPLVADQFLYFAELLAPLRRDELILLGRMCRHADELKSWELDMPDLKRMFPPQSHSRYAAIGVELVPSVFPDGLSFAAAAASLVRTGLIAPQYSNAYGGSRPPHYVVTPRLRELMRLIDIEAALDTEERK